MTFWSAPDSLALPHRRAIDPAIPGQVAAEWNGSLRWVLAATLVLSLHGMALLLLRQQPQEMPAVTPSPVSMMIDLAPAAAPAPPALLHPPMTAETPALPTSPPVPQADTAPPSLPTMSRPQLLQRPAAVALPAAAKPQPQPTIKPTPKVKAKPAQQQVQKPATPAMPVAQPVPTPPPAIASTASQQQAAPAQRETAAEAATLAAKSSWLGDVVQHIAKFKRKPRSRLVSQTTVVVGFDIDRSGKLRSRRLVQSGGNAAIDAEALAWIDRADPLPLPPTEVSDAELARGFRLPLQFTLR
jgi:protein TonB